MGDCRWNRRSANRDDGSDFAGGGARRPRQVHNMLTLAKKSTQDEGKARDEGDPTVVAYKERNRNDDATRKTKADAARKKLGGRASGPPTREEFDCIKEVLGID